MQEGEDAPALECGCPKFAGHKWEWCPGNPRTRRNLIKAITYLDAASPKGYHGHRS